MKRRETIVVAGALAQKAERGGHAWVLLQYLLGFKRLGFDVLFLDWIEAEQCRDRAGRPAPFAESENCRRLRAVMDEFGLSDCWAVATGGGHWTGLDRREVLRRVGRSLFLLNVMGYLKDREVLAAAPWRVFLDIDPGFGQMWRQLGLADVFAGHDAWVTIGERIGAADCPIPDCGLDWVKTPQPVVLERWPASETGRDAVSSVASWRGAYGPVRFGGRTYGLRVHEFRKFFPLPRRVDAPFVLALDIDADETRDLAAFRKHGWNLISPAEVASTPARYRDFIQASAAEFMVAKNMYVDTRCGWISDRTLCYLASGRPAVVQDTGLAGLYPNGEGLLLFSNLEEAVEAITEALRDHRRHSRAARRLAEEFFDSDKVLNRLLSGLGAL